MIDQLSAIIGNWETSGLVQGENTKITGTDSYEFVLDGAFVLHKANVMMGDKKMVALEMIGNQDEHLEKYNMYAFDNSGIFSTMKASVLQEDVFFFEGDESRSTLTVSADRKSMTAIWEKLQEETWINWMDLEFKLVE